MFQFISFAYSNEKRLVCVSFPGNWISHSLEVEWTFELNWYTAISVTWMFPSSGERLSVIWWYIRLACYPSLDMLNVIGELVLLLLGTAITATLQFHSPRCDQLSSSQLSFVVEWWRISPYLNNPTSSTSEHPNKSPPPTEGLL